MEKQLDFKQFRPIQRIFNCFLFRNYSAIARNKMLQAELQPLSAIPCYGIPIGNPRYSTSFTRDYYCTVHCSPLSVEMRTH